MEINLIEVVQSVILPTMTVLLGYFGWRANADKNKLMAELKGMEAANTAKDIENKRSWLELYEDISNDQAVRLTNMQAEIQTLIKNIKKLENALNKIHNCRYYDVCPVRDALELSKPQRVINTGQHRKPTTNRQREPVGDENDTPDSNTTDDSETELDT
jgi:hypothetical protein